ncbi:uncharacterized protein LOC117117581 [Anneissia japonica]|uniref:uncharacterized protein LOC117117581 n=1 Tax=Anneissia japonica TaxID=1529436 RepID=UPI001425755B|nr:uncharacterized protein LOC117117581 [Anneissia japonica]
MSLKVVVLLCSVYVLAWGQNKCCLPKQYQGSSGLTIANVGGLNTTTAVGTLSKGISTYAYDYTNKRDATISNINVTTSVGTFPVTQHTITDYKKSIRWVITDKNCTAEAVDRNMSSPCIPDNATYIGEMVIGGVLQADQWRYTINGGMNASMTVTNTCIPIDLTIYSYNTDGMMLESITLADFMPKILAPHTFFNVPKNCPQKPPASQKTSNSEIKFPRFSFSRW